MSNLLWVSPFGSEEQWANAKIWVVPSADPNGAEGPPAVGSPNFVWARVRNTADRPAEHVGVRFYFTPMSTWLQRDHALPLGESVVTLAPGEERDVLCVSEWTPQTTDDERGCIIVELHHWIDPLPTPPPSYFTYLGHTQVGIKNVTLLKPQVGQQVAEGIPLWLSPPTKHYRPAHVRIEQLGRPPQDEAALLRQAGIAGYERISPDGLSFGISTDPIGNSWRGTTELIVQEESVPIIYVFAESMGSLAERYVHLQVAEYSEDGECRGGVTLLVTTEL